MQQFRRSLTETDFPEYVLHAGKYFSIAKAKESWLATAPWSSTSCKLHPLTQPPPRQTSWPCARCGGRRRPVCLTRRRLTPFRWISWPPWTIGCCRAALRCSWCSLELRGCPCPRLGCPAWPTRCVGWSRRSRRPSKPWRLRKLRNRKVKWRIPCGSGHAENVGRMKRTPVRKRVKRKFLGRCRRIFHCFSALQQVSLVIAATKFARYAPKGFKLKPDLFQSVPKFSRAGANNFHRFVNLLTFVSATVWQLSLGSQLDELRWMLLSTTFNFKAQATHSCLGLSSYECRRCCKWIHTGNVMFWCRNSKKHHKTVTTSIAWLYFWDAKQISLVKVLLHTLNRPWWLDI